MPGIPVTIGVPSRRQMTRMIAAMAAAWKNSGTISLARIDQRWMGLARSLSV